MKICGSCSTELRCLKTGLTTHDTRYHPSSTHSPDLYVCPDCRHLFINRKDGEYFSEDPSNIQCTIHDGLYITYSEEFKTWAKQYYQGDLP
jgi:hypothetical protein